MTLPPEPATARDVIANHFYTAHEWNGTYALTQADRTIAALHAAGFHIGRVVEKPRKPFVIEDTP